MKRFEVVISGEHEEETGAEILRGLCRVIAEHGREIVSITTESITEDFRHGRAPVSFLKQAAINQGIHPAGRQRGIDIPDFLRKKTSGGGQDAQMAER